MTPEETVRAFFDRLAAHETESALELLDPDIEWRNTGLPTIRGRRVHGMLRDMERRKVAFTAEWHHVAADGDVVLTERTDTIRAGRATTTFPVRGRFEVRDGRIVLWDDAFSWLAVARSGFSGLGRLLR